MLCDVGKRWHRTRCKQQHQPQCKFRPVDCPCNRIDIVRSLPTIAVKSCRPFCYIEIGFDFFTIHEIYQCFFKAFIADTAVHAKSISSEIGWLHPKWNIRFYKNQYAYSPGAIATKQKHTVCLTSFQKKNSAMTQHSCLFDSRMSIKCQ